MPAYFLGFDVCKINADGVMSRQPFQTVQVYDLTNSTSLGTITANSRGVIGNGSFALPAGTQIQFSVTGYTPTIERTLTAIPEYLAIPTLSLVIENLYTPPLVDPAYNDIYVKIGSEVTKVGRIAPGETLSIPYNPALDSAIEIYAIARTAQGLSDTFDLSNAVKLDLTPNRETGSANFSQDGSATNTQVNFIATGFTVAKFRKIQYALDSGFTSGLVEKSEGNLNADLSANFNITRTVASGSLTVYVRIAHSTSNQNWGAWSPTKTATFADSGGSGGSGGGTPPTSLTYYQFGNDIYLNWIPGSGSNHVYRNGVDIASGSGLDNYVDTLIFPGYYTYSIQNSDGSSDEISFYFSA